MVLLASLAMSSRAAAQTAGIKVGAAAPEVMIQTLDGQTVRLSEFTKGKPAVLEFWATWCPLCKKLEPAMAAAQAKHGKDVVFISVGVREKQTPEAQKAYVRERKLGGHFVFDQSGEAVKAFQVPHTSFVVVIDAGGRVVYTGVGPDQNIEAAIGNVMMQTGMN
jgi:methylamine dehydrogenase accessory protein MauD